MPQFTSVQEILDFAIAREEEAARLYNQMAQGTKPWMAEIFKGFAAEEMKHQARLQAVKRGKMSLGGASQTLDLHLSDYLVEPGQEAWDGLDYQKALIIAMKREKAAFRLYNDLAAASQETGLKELFLGLAQEEARHKLRIEVEYDEVVLRDN